MSADTTAHDNEQTATEQRSVRLRNEKENDGELRWADDDWWLVSGNENQYKNVIEWNGTPCSVVIFPGSFRLKAILYSDLRTFDLCILNPKSIFF